MTLATTMCCQLAGQVPKCLTTSFKQSVWKTCAHTVMDNWSWRCLVSQIRRQQAPVSRNLVRNVEMSECIWHLPLSGLPPSKCCTTADQLMHHPVLLQECAWKTWVNTTSATSKESRSRHKIHDVRCLLLVFQFLAHLGCKCGTQPIVVQTLRLGPPPPFDLSVAKKYGLGSAWNYKDAPTPQVWKTLTSIYKWTENW